MQNSAIAMEVAIVAEWLPKLLSMKLAPDFKSQHALKTFNILLTLFFGTTFSDSQIIKDDYQLSLHNRAYELYINGVYVFFVLILNPN